MSQVTKRALVASLKNQLLKKPLDKVTISDITDDCGISRMTFYYHFKDIYDLIEWAFEEEASRILEGKKDYDTWQQGYLRIFEDLNANKPFIMNVYRSISREKVENYLYRITYDLLIHVINEKAKSMNVRDEDKKFLANFYKYAFVGLVLDWIKHDMKDDPNIIVADLSVAIHGSVSAALERYRNRLNLKSYGQRCLSVWRCPFLSKRRS